ncbi:hypothetical protein CYMTET_32343 [Cymbomonas tetramitiformis]|uniref:Uncharacterized protein n=1 Tax=Cymbomonas tetramitiformis TaxID=36881 RepID=A0AAE0KSB0_9CHLO|nr:hypothetical protein CYMTET_32343 [Cymbomonas tetramitiformis]
MHQLKSYRLPPSTCQLRPRALRVKLGLKPCYLTSKSHRCGTTCAILQRKEDQRVTPMNLCEKCTHDGSVAQTRRRFFLTGTAGYISIWCRQERAVAESLDCAIDAGSVQGEDCELENQQQADARIAAAIQARTQKRQEMADASPASAIVNASAGELSPIQVGTIFVGAAWLAAFTVAGSFLKPVMTKQQSSNGASAPSNEDTTKTGMPCTDDANQPKTDKTD